MSELAKLPGHSTPTSRDWSRISRQWRVRIAELQRLRVALTECIG
jgi:hypothetical protein